LHRLAGNGVPRMPPLATRERDLGAEALLTAWINTELPTRESFAQWQVTHFAGTTSPEAQPDANPDGDAENNDLEFLLRQNPLVTTLPYRPLVHVIAGEYVVTFEHPANRAVLVETSTDLVQWTRWDVPGNFPFHPATTQQRTLTGPAEGPARFFRLRISAL
jgi:hypothetical protein